MGYESCGYWGQENFQAEGVVSIQVPVSDWRRHPCDWSRVRVGVRVTGLELGEALLGVGLLC